MLVLKDEQESYYEFYVNEGDDKPVGHLRIREFANRIELWGLAIDGLYRNRGYGQQMIKEAIEFANGRKVVLFVMQSNPIAIHVYEKCGFKKTSQFCGNAWRMTYHEEDKKETDKS